jgi:RNA-directed DNA polymerase
VKDRVGNDIGANGHLEAWADIEWKSVKKRVKDLRQRIYRATKNGQWNRVRSLMKLMMRSYSNLLLSVRRVTQDNAGKQTAGVDGQTALRPNERVKLVNDMGDHTLWKAAPAKRVYIPKANGKQRPLGIPTVKNRVAQAVVKNALEPVWEAQFEAESYGFRPGRSVHDAIYQSWIRLNGRSKDEWVLDADIKGAFDNISHEYILNAIGELPGRELIKQWLKAGYMEAEMFHKTESGTPQGGIISPLLANIALTGMTELLNRYKTLTQRTVKTGNRAGQVNNEKSNKYGYIRYADDFIVTARSKEDIEAIIPEVVKWLSQRGLKLNEEKTQIRHINQGFNFLGFNLRQYKGKCLTKPQKEKVLAKLREIKEWLDKNHNLDPEIVIAQLSPILRGWANYYKHGASKRVFSYIDHRICRMLIKWAIKRHLNKGKKWIIRRYFTRVGNDNWVFKAKAKDRSGNYKEIHLYKMTNISIVRHTKVKGIASPDDPNLREYWEKRQTKMGKIHFAKGSKLYQIAENQQWKCPVCLEHLFNGEEIQTHHIHEVRFGGTDIVDNLTHVHTSCHRSIHGRRSKKQGA